MMMNITTIMNMTVMLAMFMIKGTGMNPEKLTTKEHPHYSQNRPS